MKKLLNLLTQVRRRKITPGLYTFNTKNYKILKFNHNKNYSSRYNIVKVQIPRVINSLNNNDKQYVNTLLKNGTVLAVHPDYVPLQSWIDAQNNYINSLNDYDLETAMAYTVRSYEWIGEWLRTRNTSKLNFTTNKNFVVPLYPQIMRIIQNSNNAWAKNALNINNRNRFIYMLRFVPDDILTAALELYTKDLHRIIKNAPPLPKQMIVFRGIDTDVFKGKLGAVHKLTEFASSSYVPQSSYATHGYIRIKLLKGTRVLLLQGLNKWKTHGEYEVLVNIGSKYIIRKRNLKRYSINIPNKNARKLFVTDVTILT